MDHKEMFLKHWVREGPVTRKVIGRIPLDGSNYRPDPKARTAPEIGWLMVREEVVLGDSMEKGAMEWVEVPAPAAVSEILAEYDRRHDKVTAQLQALPASRWEETVPFLHQGKEVMRMAAHDMAWAFLLDQIHHRGQLSTYLRPMGAKVPAIYGGSADESP
jgi:uncharacterized damage-inducible protein DinB